MEIIIGTNLIKLIGPPFNNIEAVKIENLTRNQIINYKQLKREINKNDLIIIQIFSDIFIISTEKDLNISKIIKEIENSLLKPGVIIDYSKEKYNIKYEELKFDNNFVFTNYIIPNILKEAFLNTLKNNLEGELVIDYKENKIFLLKKNYDINGFIFKFEIDEKFNIYLKIDAIFPSDFNELKYIRKLPSSKERKEKNDKILLFLKKFQIFCGGKIYYFDSNFLNFKKNVIEREC